MLAKLFGLLSVLFLAHSYNYTRGGKDWGGFCTNSTLQSPINIRYSRSYLPAPATGQITYDIDQIQLSGGFSPTGLVLTGDIGYFNITEGVNVRRYDINSVYFFAPAQNYINSRRYSLELTFTNNVFEEYAYSVIFKIGSPLPIFDEIQQCLNGTENPKVNFGSIIPNPVNYFYAFDGSVPFPPCTEPIRWYVYYHTYTISEDQLEFFTSHWAGNSSFANGNGNSRYVQSLGGRRISYYRPN